MTSFLKVALIFVALLALPVSAQAQFFSGTNADSPFRQAQYIATADRIIATTPTLRNNAAALVVNAASIAALEDDVPTAIPSASINTIYGYRTLGIEVFEASGTDLVATVTIRGETMFGRTAVATIDFPAGGGFAQTPMAFTGDVSIVVTAQNAAASDTIKVGTRYFGVPINNSDVNTIWKSATPGNTDGDDGTWIAGYHVYIPEATIARGDELNFTAFQRSRFEPFYRGPLTVRLTAISNNFNSIN